MERKAGFEVQIGAGDLAFDSRDATLLRTIDETGSLNQATDRLGRSYSHAQRRLVELEDRFGPLVERERGGSGGGGSRLTETAEELLVRFDGLQAELSGVVDVARTALPGTVRERDGEFAAVETSAGALQVLVPEGVTPGAAVEVWLRADAVTLNAPDDAPEPDATSARNRFAGDVLDVDRGETVALVAVDAGADVPLHARVTQDSVERLGLEPGDEVVVTFKATATRAIPKE
ncbi:MULTISPECIES: TOBE domain-containing protein [Halorussus]|uniref:TOBE domain-containing protein n=1 Tax=Halorussus TaxID=1070314 RepID=UPI000E2158A6|nr:MULTISPECIES: TOBE domain-containing protein [Halorussus]NHN57492.1 TOBE domain-containing protein [Halorussus sp. JP-T4]